MKFTDIDRASMCFIRALLKREHSAAISSMHKTSCAESIDLIQRLIDRGYATARQSVVDAYLELHGECPTEMFVDRAVRRLLANEVRS